MTFTKLVVGTPRWPVRPPRGNPSPCVDEYLTGLIQRDGGFENNPATHSRSEIPVANAARTVLTWPSDSATVDGDDVGWMQEDVAGASVWTVSDANPDVGTYHARVSYDGTTPVRLWVVGAKACADDVLWSARGNPGDRLRFDFRHRGGSVDVSLRIVWYDEAGTELNSSNVLNQPSGSTYAGPLRVSSVCPASGYWALCSVEAAGPLGTLDIDTVEVETPWTP